MLYTSLFNNPAYWGIPLIVQIISYVQILRKMGKNPLKGLVPLIGDWEMSKDLFRYRRSFWRPAIIMFCMTATVYVIGSDSILGIILNFVSLNVYGVFLIRLYRRLAKQFGKNIGFALGMIFLPVIFLPILAFGKSKYLGKIQFKERQSRSKVLVWFRRAAITVVSAVELLALLLVCFLITLLVRPLRPITQMMMNETIEQLASVTDTDEIIGREETLGEDAEEIIDGQRTRDYYFPDHSADSKVVVMEYIIGSNLEDARGCASVNISQMLEATKKGNGLDFVVQAGGCDRWFTQGIDDATVGRYLISGGKLETAQMLDDGMCLSEPQNLTDFIVWTRENYPADRYMLVLWDHGGGFASGYGSDDLNDREDEEMTMSASEIIGAVREADTKFDVIGFDACLMQNVEFAYAFEPYADYYLASEESEPGTGWFYTAGFGKLAADPTLSTAEFGKSMITSYDQSNRATNDGEPQRDFTLSLVDLTQIKPVYEQLTDIYKMASNEITENRIVFSVMSAARSRAYEFGDDEQVDLVSFLMNLKNADYEEQVLTDEEIDRIAQTAKACVVYRNSDAAEGTNGISIDFPYDDLYIYSEEHKQLKAVKYTTEQDFFDRFCSIMASQQKKKYADDDSLWGLLSLIDYSEEEWYIEGFEDYDTADLFIDIPVIELDDGFLPELPDKTWAAILDCTVAAYLETEEGMMYIGQEHFADEDDEGHPIVYMDGRWAHVAGTPVCYETEDPLVTEEGIVYRGTAKAILNGTEHVTLHIEWEPLKEDGDESELKGKVTGYTLDDEEGFSFMKKGLEQFDTGDTIDFVFDFYDENGELIKTGTYGNRLHIISEDYLVVKDEEFPSGTRVQFFGVLTDIFQRQMITEELYAVVQ